ncbi:MULTISPECIES: SOS response-associated peptidase [Auritidibacter]|nr:MULTISPECIES: SOS response-associated peptidase [Auritidibacter]PXA80342.1 hypothetical protein DCC25_06085 [Auritidibacter sp. NML120636]RMX23059.1 SOS response-associated peptidase [Auritidibacter ignavus]WGH82020.1 SOS response-associated peptidase [Auritidibacter ignavus]WGH85068.1 SOS response-associated peptidase [Auritidibacter ignavus]WGH86627.1 SOS response-associated peptidase [Auritidibacter ignavus]
MCGRFVMARAIGDLVAAAGAHTPEEQLELREDYNVAPTKDVAIVVERPVEATSENADDSGGHVRREVHLAHWGLVPGWAKDLSFGSRTFNARSETVVTKPSFRAAVRSQRCAVPVDGYYEWKKLPGTTARGTQKKQPYYVSRKDGAPIFFAGLYEWWADPEIATDDPRGWVLSTTILTGASPEPGSSPEVLDELAGLHDRFPLPMNQLTMDHWLAPEKLTNADQAQALVDTVVAQAYDTAGDQWQMHPVSTAVGNVRNNGPELTKPVETQHLPGL